jgi:hypothetical protein
MKEPVDKLRDGIYVPLSLETRDFLFSKISKQKIWPIQIPIKPFKWCWGL